MSYTALISDIRVLHAEPSDGLLSAPPHPLLAPALVTCVVRPSLSLCPVSPPASGVDASSTPTLPAAGIEANLPFKWLACSRNIADHRPRPAPHPPRSPP